MDLGLLARGSEGIVGWEEGITGISDTKGITLENLGRYLQNWDWFQHSVAAKHKKRRPPEETTPVAWWEGRGL